MMHVRYIILCFTALIWGTSRTNLWNLHPDLAGVKSLAPDKDEWRFQWFVLKLPKIKHILDKLSSSENEKWRTFAPLQRLGIKCRGGVWDLIKTETQQETSDYKELWDIPHKNSHFTNIGYSLFSPFCFKKLTKQEKAVQGKLRYIPVFFSFNLFLNTSVLYAVLENYN